MPQSSVRDAEKASCQRVSTSLWLIKMGEKIRNVLISGTAVDSVFFPQQIFFAVLPCRRSHHCALNVVNYLCYDVKFHYNNLVLLYANANQPLVGYYFILFFLNHIFSVYKC